MRSQFTRVVHLLLLLIVLHQLIGSTFMQRPFPGDPPSWPFVLHEYVGLESLGVLAAFWIWVLFRRGETGLGKLFPWFSVVRLQDVLADLMALLRRIARGKVPHEDSPALASAIHGLGLLTVTAMALTGFTFFLARGTPVAHTSLALHKLIANLMWGYLVAHAGFACLHHLLGSDIFSRMFWLAPRPGRARNIED